MAFGNIAGRVRLPGGISIGANIPIGVDPRKARKQSAVGGSSSTPMNSITRMMANVKNAGLFSRPYLYYVFITPPKNLMGKHPIQGVQLNCSAISIPGFTMATKEHKVYGLKREYVYEKLFDIMSMTFYMSEEMHEHNFFNAWMDQMYIKGRVNYYKEYVSTIEIYQCSGTKDTEEEDLSVMMKVKLIDAFPKVLSALPLGYETAGTIQRMSTDITFRDVQYINYMNQDPSKESGLMGSINDSISHAKKAFGSFTEVGSLLQGKFDALSLPKVGSILKQKRDFLPVSNLGGMIQV